MFNRASAKEKYPTCRERALADALHRLADEAMRGQVRSVVLTVIRPDGSVERLDHFPGVAAANG
jgi:hypothetical protein